MLDVDIMENGGLLGMEHGPWISNKMGCFLASWEKGVKMSTIPMERGVILVCGIEHGYPVPYEVGVPGPGSTKLYELSCTRTDHVKLSVESMKLI